MTTFKKGQPVKVLLDESHNIADDAIEHDATFVNEHADGKWADVDLAEEHPSGTRRLSVPLSLIKAAVLLFALLSLCPLFPKWGDARAQFIGYTGLQTVSSLLANNTACTGATQTFSVQNLGQISHQVSATSNASSFVVEIDGTDPTGASYRISNAPISFVNGSTVSYIMQGYGYYSLLQVKVICSAASTFSLSYAGGQAAFSSIIGPPSGNPFPLGGGLSAQVQGVASPFQSAGTINPVISGGLQLPINSNFAAVGIDTFGAAGNQSGAGSSFTFTVATAPTPSQGAPELGLVFFGFNAGTSGALVAPWSSVTGAAGICSGGAPQFCMGQSVNLQPGSVLKHSWGNSFSGGNELAQFIAVTSGATGATVRQANVQASTLSTAFGSNTLSGSLLLASMNCPTTTPCTVSSVSDTQGLTWQPIGSILRNNGTLSSGVNTWAAITLSSAAADTVTMVCASCAGASNGMIVAEITGQAPANLNTPAGSVAVDTVGDQVVRLDAQSPNQFVCTVTMSTLTTTQCQPAPTNVNNIAARLYVTDFQINTTTAGTTSTIQLKTGFGTNCGTSTANLSAITYTDVAAGLTNVLGMRTPLIAPLQSAVCVTQAGAVAGTATVEVHGFIAP